MADIQFPDIGNALASGASAAYAGAQRNYLAEDRKAKASAAPFIGSALAGDPTALSEVATRHPDTAMKLAPLLERMDAGQRTRAKEAAEYTAGAANAILQADPAERPAIYQQVLADGKARGFDLSRLPPQYTPQLDPQLRTYRSMAIPMLEHFKQTEGGVQFAPPAGGGATPAGAIGGIESGGKYDAVGPVANAQGQRAYGKYQVLEPNVGPWTQEVLGKAMTPQEFLANPQAQDAVFKTKFGQYQAKYGPEGAARAWFAGEGGMNNPNAKDVLGTTVQGYGQKFTQATNPAGGATGGFAPPDVARATSMPPQGDGGPPDSPAGAGPQPQGAPVPIEAFKGVQFPPGYRVGTKGGKIFEAVPGYVQVMPPGGGAPILWPVPKPKEHGDGPFAGTSMDAQARNLVLQGDPSTASYAAAYAHLAEAKITIDPQSGTPRYITPDMSWARPPAFRGGGQPVAPGVTVQATPPGAPPSVGQAPITTTLPSGQTVTAPPGSGKPIPGAENEKIAAGVTAITNIDKALEQISNPQPGAQPSGRAAGWISRNMGQTGDLIAQEMDPQGVAFRSTIADVSSQLLLARSGAAVTDGEYKRLVALLPSPAEKPEVIKEKLAQIRSTLVETLKNQYGQYAPANGYIPHEGAQRILAPKPAAAPPNASPSTPQGVSEGATATNPQTGQKIIYRGGQWGPLQ